MINRRRLLWFCVSFVLIGAIIAAWFALARRDADFVTVGPKTKGVRENFTKLDVIIDPADFRDCKTVRDAVARLNEKLRPPDPVDRNEPILWNWNWRHWLRTNDVAFNLPLDKDLLSCPFQLPANSSPLTVKQLLRLTFAQTGVQDVSFIVRGHYLEATTAKSAQEERSRYLDSASVYDRMHNFWKEMTGVVEDDPPEFLPVATW